MAEILIKAKDNKMPTIQEWRTWMTTKGLPQANAFLAANPYTEQDFATAHANMDRIQGYHYALNMLRRYAEGKIKLTTEQYTRFLSDIAIYDANPITQAQLDKVRYFFKELKDESGSKIPSIESRWRYYRNLVDVESLKTDVVKDAELRLKERCGSNRSGDIVNLKPDGWSNGEHWHQSAYHPSEGKFILVKCPEITVEQAIAYRDSWKDDLAYEVVSQNAQQGIYVVRVFEQNAGAKGQNNLTQAKIETFLTKWGCIGLTFTPNSCQFTFSLWNAVRSIGFWNFEDSGLIIFTLVSYNATTGIGRVTADYTSLLPNIINGKEVPIEERVVLLHITEHGGVVISTSGRTVTFEIERSNLLTRFKEDVKREAEQVYMCHRYQVSAADVDAVVAAGGIITLTKAQVLAKLKDKMA